MKTTYYVYHFGNDCNAKWQKSFKEFDSLELAESWIRHQLSEFPHREFKIKIRYTNK